MASTKKSVSKTLPWHMAWKNFFFAASVTLNVASLVVFITMTTTNALDGMWIREGVTRYCATANDGKFKDSTETAQAMRDFTCARGDAQDDFETAMNAYLESRGLSTQ